MTHADLPEVLTLAGLLHPGYPESAAVFADRLALAPGCCRMLPSLGHASLDHASLNLASLGYAIAHPWAGTVPPPLDSVLGTLPALPDCLHLHDIALHPAARGSGQAAAVVTALLAAAAAAGLGRASLLALPGKADYWARLGFRPAAWPSGPALDRYGPGALPMERRLSRCVP